MKHILFSIVFFSIFVNLAVGIMMSAIPAFADMDSKLGLDGDDVSTKIDNEVEDSFGDPINVEPSMEDPQDVNTNTLLDKSVIGGIGQIKNFLNKYMFGFVTLLQSLFTNTVATNTMFAAIKSIITILYVITGIQLITGRSVY